VTIERDFIACNFKAKAYVSSARAPGTEYAVRDRDVSVDGGMPAARARKTVVCSVGGVLHSFGQKYSILREVKAEALWSSKSV
jgi:hypothetical protein